MKSTPIFIKLFALNFETRNAFRFGSSCRHVCRHLADYALLTRTTSNDLK
jgi:hypothetical protein